MRDFKFAKVFEKKVREKFPLMFKGYKFDIEKFFQTFPKSAEKITAEILKEREDTANSREADN